ncbi:outer membrane beta-barrel protein [Klebsiella aerogenes]|uniref:outer membrane beta-barrel protein n=1 Tax=Klebsiella aerogenes TaxID=548 RepID=UPI0034D2D61E
MRRSVMATRIALLLAGAGLAGQALAAAPADSWYAGVKAGWSDYYDADIGHDLSPGADRGTEYNLHGSNAAGGVFVGYQALDWLAVEGGYDYLGNASITSNNAYGAHLEGQGMQLGVKMSLPLTDSWDLYARGGVMGWVTKTESGGHNNTDNGASPLAALGTEFGLGDNLAMRLEYQYTSNVGNGNDDGVKADNGQTSLGVVYRFGHNDPAPLPVVTPPPPPPPPAPVSLQTAVHFDTGSSVLSEPEQQNLNAWMKAVNAQVKQGHMTVTGYADRTGRPGANQLLSEARADQVAGYLKTQQENTMPVEVTGQGTASPVTDGECDSVTKVQSLKDCLAPDRRVEVHVVSDGGASQ